MLRRDLNLTAVVRMAALLAVASALLLESCASSKKCGDTRFVHTPAFPLAVADAVVFPKIPIGQRGAFTYHVTNLPRCIYPEGFRLKIPAFEADRQKHDQPWRNTILRAAIILENGKVLYERSINFASDWNGNFDDANRRIALIFRDPAASLPTHTSYIFRVGVLKPSARSTDQLEIEALAFD